MTAAGREAAPDGGEQFIVRAAAARALSLAAGIAHSVNGYGFSVQTASGISPENLDAGAPNTARYSGFSVSTVRRLQAIPGIRGRFPTLGGGPNQGTVNLPFPPPPGIFDAIQEAFEPRRNPFGAS